MTLLALEKVVAGYRHPVVGPVSLTVKPGKWLGWAAATAVGRAPC